MNDANTREGSQRVVQERLVMHLYLDFDGVLHPSEVYLVDGEPVLQLCNDQSPEMLFLFCWASILESMLDDFDPEGRIKIILSTSWVRVLGFDESKARLPEGLQNRVIRKMRRSMLNDFPRGVEISEDARRSGLEHWIAIDDDAWAWPEEHLNELVWCDPTTGVASRRVQELLKQKITEMLNAH
jgi:hypothetical protein